MIRIAICDDNSVHLQTASQRVDAEMKQHDRKYSAKLFHSAEELIHEIEQNGYSPEIAVLDIEMDGEDGITLAKRLNQYLPLCRIIFLTSYIDYAPEVYEAEHIWFVVKKTADQFFPAAMKKALTSLDTNKAPVPAVITREKGTSHVIPITQILYISKVGRKSHVCCEDMTYSDYRRPADLIPAELEKYFIHCHQGYWVCIHAIQELDHMDFVLKNGTRIPISRNYREDARKRFFDSMVNGI